MEIQNAKVCPICRENLRKEIIIDDRDVIHVVCNACGEYAMTREFYEDNLEPETVTTMNNRKRLVLFLASHKNDKLHPLLSQCSIRAAKGYKCFPCLTRIGKA